MIALEPESRTEEWKFSPDENLRRCGGKTGYR
jgi:hypothetical protein